ncbi:hypothetical protein [Phenylobacterium sp.]|uniref:hypothetical protein n=1 Tax=Phenylobacterium sp. TaxID=1871053 RepID=UPI0025EC61A9|nr:hypothetical protein [Phenylobacterium sp.]
MSLFPDVSALARELDVYVGNLAALDEMRKRLVAPLLHRLATSEDIFDSDTQLLSSEVARPVANTSTPPSPAATALGLRWLRGALASMGRVVIAGFKHYGSEWPKMAARWTGDSASGLGNSIVNFLKANAAQLFDLAREGHSFRWLRMLLELIGLSLK